MLATITLVVACGSDSFESSAPGSGGGSSGKGGGADTGGSKAAGGSDGVAGDDTGMGGDAGANSVAGAGGTSTGGTGGGSAGEGGTGGVTPACDLDAPFGTPEPLNDVNTEATEARAWLSDDLLTIYFDRDYVLHRATRSSPSDPFGMAMPLPADISSGYNPVLSRDGLRLFFTRSADIYVATRESVLVEFSDPAPVAGVNSGSNEWMSSVSGDGTLYFHSDVDGDIDIYSSELLPNESYATPVPVGSLNSPDANDGDAIVSADGLTMYFLWGDAPTPGIYRARRSTMNDGFGTPEQLEELGDAWPTWISADECMILIGDERPGGDGGLDFFMAEKPR